MSEENSKRTHLHVVKDDEGDQRSLYPNHEAFKALFDDLLTIYVKTGKHLQESQDESNEKKQNSNFNH